MMRPLIVVAVGLALTVSAPVATAEPVAGTAGLRADLAAAFSAAEAEATAAGIPLWITSGKRSWAQQDWLWHDGLARYGTPAQARRWVLPPAESTHVTGDAIDVGPWDGAAWLQNNGYRWGLCRIFDNEWWHFERVTEPGGMCPARVPDASLR